MWTDRLVKPDLLEASARDGCELARICSDRGEYAEAARALAEVWDGPGTEPRLEELSPETAADVLLWAGMVEGFLGQERRTPGAQERSKDLIGRALFAFEELGLQERAASAQVGLAACYFRAGAYDDARMLLGGALERLVDNNERLRALLGAARNEIAAKRYDDALALYDQAAPLVESSRDDLRRGIFHNTRGQARYHVGVQRRDAQMFAEAAADYVAAIDFYGRVGHLRYAGYIHNNLGCLHNAAGRPAEAHLSLDRAREIFESLKDGNCMAQVDDTRATVLMDEGQHEEAVSVSARAVELLSQGDDYGLLVGALTTHATALARAGRAADSAATFSRAIALADERVSGEEGKRIGAVMADELAACAYPLAGINYNDAVWRVEHRLIEDALKETGGIVKHAAMKLGLQRQHLDYIVRERHPQLLRLRPPIKPLKRSIIDRPKAGIKPISKGKKSAGG